MAKDSLISVRLDSKLKAAIDEAARRDQRSTSAMVVVILSEWARAKGLLADDDKPKAHR